MTRIFLFFPRLDRGGARNPMKCMLALCVAWTLAGGAEAAQNNFLKASVSGKRVCVLGFQASGEQGRLAVRCWKGASEAEASLVFEEPTDVAIGYRVGGVHGEYVCAISKGRVQCLGEQARKLNQAFSGLAAPLLLSSGNYDVCAYDRDKGVHCEGGEVQEVRWTRIAEQAPKSRAVKLLAVGTFYACAVESNNQITCWGGVRDQYVPLLGAKTRERLAAIDAGIRDTPRGLANPTALSVGLSHACVIDDGRAHCWGHDLSGESLPPKDLVQVEQIDAGNERTCVIASGKVVCFGKETPFSQSIGRVGADFAVALAGSKEEVSKLETQCLITAQMTHCRGRQNLDVAHEIFGYHLFNIESQFDYLSTHVYRWKAGFLRRMASLARGFLPQTADYDERQRVEARLFLLNVARSFIKSINTEFFEVSVQPQFNLMADHYDRVYQVRGIAELPRTQTTLKLALILLQEALSACRQMLIDETDIKMTQDLSVTLAMAVARKAIAPSDIDGVLRELEKQQVLFRLLQLTPSTAGLGALVEELKGFLQERI